MSEFVTLGRTGQGLPSVAGQSGRSLRSGAQLTQRRAHPLLVARCQTITPTAEPPMQAYGKRVM